MKCLLQDFETGLYLAGDATWAELPEKAMVFPDEARATGYKMARRLRNAFAVAPPRINSPLHELLQAGYVTFGW